MPNSRKSVALTTRTTTLDPDAPWVLSYFAQRRIAGWIGICLPIVVAVLTVFVDPSRRLPDSISASYYTIARNYFVTSLASVGIFLISAVGYDEDRSIVFRRSHGIRSRVLSLHATRVERPHSAP